jgi:hypothetical protein
MESLIPKDDREFSIEVALGSDVFPLGKLGFSYKKAWEHRVSGFVQAVCDASGKDEDAIYAHIEGGGEFGDLFLRAMEVSAKKGERTWRNAWGRIVAAALADPARIDEVAFVIEKADALSPAHLRMFWFVYGLVKAAPDPRRGADPDEVHNLVAEKFQVAQVVALGFLKDLDGAGFIQKPLAGNYWITPLGRLAVDLVGEIDDVLVSPSWAPPI